MVEYLEPDKTLITDCVPTICEVGVTRGIKPSSFLTFGISLITLSNLSIES